MKIIQSVKGILEEKERYKNQTVGFVPTMGYLHKGHLSLVQQSKKENAFTVVSIFVNPIQFGPGEDFNRYPRDIKRDENLLKDLGVDLVFYPDSEEIFPPGFCTFVEVEEMGEVLCGKSRPTHFRGVTTIVLKLFNIVEPDNAYFGQKDAQQLIILNQMVKDLNLNITLRAMPIVRDVDSLALSSRNSYLSEFEREAATLLPKALNMAKEQINKGLRKVSQIKEIIEHQLKKNPLITIEYIEVVSLDKLEDVSIDSVGIEINTNNTLIAAAIKVGRTRLIDNFILGEI
jgi:pantoate--beta-alanine ligase